MTAPATVEERLAAAFSQLTAEGRPDLVRALRELIGGGHLTASQALEAITAAEETATAMGTGDITKEQASSLAKQLVERHHSGRAG